MLSSVLFSLLTYLLFYFLTYFLLTYLLTCLFTFYFLLLSCLFMLSNLLFANLFAYLLIYFLIYLAFLLVYAFQLTFFLLISSLTYLLSPALNFQISSFVILEPGIILGPLSKDLIKSFEILLVHKGWKWCNNYLIGDRLWSIFRKWSQQQSQNNSANICSRVNDATITTAIRLIG